MAKNIRSMEISIGEKQGTFSAIFHKIQGNKKKEDNSGISHLRKLLSNEKARLLHVIKTKQPSSIYELSKLLGRDFKAVRQDIRLLEQFGLVELVSSNKNNRERLRPVVDIDTINITLNL
jgi:predicted transcriptional regulator